LKDQTLSTFLDQNPPFELRRKPAFRFQSFHEIHRGSSKYWPNPSISVGGGQQGWLAFALHNGLRQRPSACLKGARWKPAIQLDKEPAIIVRQPDVTMQLAPQNIQLMSKHRVLGLKP
jgi:hypothetical protein